MKEQRWGKKYIDKRDWHMYNEKLVIRGEAYLSLDFIKSWDRELGKLNKNKVGSPFDYPDSLIVFLAYLHTLLNIDYRGLKGFLRGLSRLISFNVPDYSTICRRVNKVDVPIKETLTQYDGEEVVIALDSTGVKVTNRGEWMRHKWKVRRGWIKVHISVDNKGKQVVGIAVTDEEVHDNEEFENLVDQSVENVEAKGGKVVQANADGAYDSNENFKKLNGHRIRPGIKIRRNVGPTFKTKKPRKKYAREFRELGYEKWRDKYDYGKRWYSESTFSAVKRKSGEYVRATKPENMFHEVKLKFIFYNALINYDFTSNVPWTSV